MSAMNPYLAFAIRSFGAFVSGLAANYGGHKILLADSTTWFGMILAGCIAMVAYQGGVISANPFTASKELSYDQTRDRL